VQALEKLGAKCSREGLERLLKSRARYMKPKYYRQKNVKDAAYNKVKRTRIALVEKLLQDPLTAPF